jgi:hypothetical protein
MGARRQRASEWNGREAETNLLSQHVCLVKKNIL